MYNVVDESVHATEKKLQLSRSYQVEKLTVIQDAPNSGPSLGINLCAVFFPSFTPVLSLTVNGMSPSALFMPTMIRPSFPTASSTAHNVNKKKDGVSDTGILTGRSAPRFEDEIDWTPAVDIHKVNIAA